MLVLQAAAATAMAGSEPLADGLQRCAREVDEKQRLACFDELAKRVPAAHADQFGMTAEITHQRHPSAPFRPEQSEVLSGTIAALREGPNGELIFTLDNAQVWRQAEAKSRIRFKVGESVHIEHGAMGSLWLAADKGRKTRVKRIS